MNGYKTRLCLALGCAMLAPLVLGALPATNVGSGSSDGAADKKRAMLAAIRRIVVVAPFFSIDRLTRPTVPPREGASGDRSRKLEAPTSEGGAHRTADKQLAEYREQLRKLTDHMADFLPMRVKTRTPYEVLAADETVAALKALDLTPEKLYSDGARIRGGRFPQPDPETVRRLAARLHADAVLLTVLDEPRLANGHYSFNPLSGIDYTSSHVGAHGGLYVVLADGKEALHEFISVDHPLTHIGSRSYLLVDWEEAHDLLIEDMLDDVTRYTPEKK